MNFGNKIPRNPNVLGNRKQFTTQLGNKFNHSAYLSQNLKKPDISDGIVNESNNHDSHHEPMGLSKMRKQNTGNLEKPKSSKVGKFV